jgi:uncharacterized DUF497 family protein
LSIATDTSSVRHPAMLQVVAKGREFLYIQEVFSWDPRKALINFQKHGVPFEEAATVFADPDGLEWDDPAQSQRERRFKRIGRSITRRIVLVVYTLRRNHDGKETVRIIGARAASRKERQAYSRSGP